MGIIIDYDYRRFYDCLKERSECFKERQVDLMNKLEVLKSAVSNSNVFHEYPDVPSIPLEFESVYEKIQKEIQKGAERVDAYMKEWDDYFAMEMELIKRLKRECDKL